MATEATHGTQGAQWQTDRGAEPSAKSVVDRPRLVLRIEIRIPASAEDRPPVRPAARAASHRPSSTDARDDERRLEVAVALAGLAGFAFVATVASLIAIFL
jgi:hypothetical protein